MEREESEFITTLKSLLEDHAWTFCRHLSEDQNPEAKRYATDALQRALGNIQEITTFKSFLTKCSDGVFDELGINGSEVFISGEDTTMMELLKATFIQVRSF